MTPFDDHLTIKTQTKKRNGLKISGAPNQESHFLNIIQISTRTHNSVFHLLLQ